MRRMVGDFVLIDDGTVVDMFIRFAFQFSITEVVSVLPKLDVNEPLIAPGRRVVVDVSK